MVHVSHPRYAAMFRAGQGFRRADQRVGSLFLAARKSCDKLVLDKGFG